uniref:Putative lipophosphoglycan biosynthetic protein 2 n=1 Tax=Trypanosoma congolense (strain IL3000) TaxID=1068625 RepID=G0UKY2_TRYCI|nr:putative lipophosphoglycan biosynthetic protein 2 [Trypanosoma congolense IL3000]
MDAHGGSLEIAVSLLVYSACSTAMTIINKLLVVNYKLNYPMGIVFLQNTFALVFVGAGKSVGWVHYPDFSAYVAKKWLPLTFFFIVMLWTSIKSLETMSVSMHTIMKNLAVVLTAVGDVILFNAQMVPPAYVSFCLIALGSFLCAKGDQWVTAWGLFWTSVNVVATAGYTLCMKMLVGDVSRSIGRYGPVFYNNLLSAPVFFVASLPSMGGMLRDISAISIPPLLGLSFVFVGPLLTLSAFWCVERTSPTTFSVIGALNKVPLTIAGIIVFGQPPTRTGYVGIALGLLGGLLYARTSYRKDNDPRKRVPSRGVGACEKVGIATATETEEQTWEPEDSV